MSFTRIQTPYVLVSITVSTVCARQPPPGIIALFRDSHRSWSLGGEMHVCVCISVKERNSCWHNVLHTIITRWRVAISNNSVISFHCMALAVKSRLQRPDQISASCYTTVCIPTSLVCTACMPISGYSILHNCISIYSYLSSGFVGSLVHVSTSPITSDHNNPGTLVLSHTPSSMS